MGMIYTFSRSILASAPILVSRMRLTIHFSPSSCDRLRRFDRSLGIIVNMTGVARGSKKKANSRYVNLLMDSAVCLANEVTCIVQELIFEVSEEKVLRNNLDRKCKLALCGIKVKFDVEFFQERRDGILVLILLCLDDFDHLADGVADTGGDWGG